jgi:hypothetical protein
MITLNMNEASVAHTRKNAALLSPCHIQNSHFRAVFCGSFRISVTVACPVLTRMTIVRRRPEAARLTGFG